MASLSKLIDLDLLETFGKGTVVPMSKTIEALSTSLQALDSEVDTLDANIGALADLDTTDKTNLVNAINELKASSGSVEIQFFNVTIPSNGWTSHNDEYYTQTVTVTGMTAAVIPAIYLAIEAGTKDIELTEAFGHLYRIESDTNSLTIWADEEPLENIPIIGFILQAVDSIRNIQVTTPPTKVTYKAGQTLDLTGIVVKANWSSGLVEDVTTNCTFSPAAGATIQAGDTEITITYVKDGNTYTTTQAITVNTLTIVPFASGTDAQIKAMLDAYYNDEITWQDMGWEVGNTRKIHLNQMQAPNPNSSNTWAAQDIMVVITGHEKEDLETPINGHTKACISVQCRECMNDVSSNYGTNGIYVNGDSSYDTTFTKWLNLYMRTFLNNTVYGAMPSGDFKSAIKTAKHNRLTTNGNNPMTAATTDGSKTNRTTEVVTDKVFLYSYTQIYGNTAYSYYLGGATPNNEEGEQLDYFKTASNRVKNGNNNGSPSGTACHWWMGSPSSNYVSFLGYIWCGVGPDGSAFFYYGDRAYGLAPAFVM